MCRLIWTNPFVALLLLANCSALAGAMMPPGFSAEDDAAKRALIKDMEPKTVHDPVAAYEVAKLQTELSHHLCGTGHQIELQDRVFGAWLAMASPEMTDDQLDAIWQLIVSGEVPTDGTRLFLIYGKAGLHRIDTDLQRAEKLVPDVETTVHPYKRMAFNNAREALRRRVAAFEHYRTAPIETLVAQHTHGVDDGLHGQLAVLYETGSSPRFRFWEPNVLIDSLVERKGESLEPLLKIVNENDVVRPTTLAALGKIGGDQAITAIKALATRQTNALDLRDSYYALLLSKDAAAVAFLQNPANTAHTLNAPVAAAWALKSHGFDASAYALSAATK